MKKPIILLDVDGVLLKWQARVPQFCLEMGLDPTAALKMQNCEKVVNPFDGLVYDPVQEIRNYNESDHMYHLPAYEDAKDFMDSVKEKFDVIFVTAQSVKPCAVKKRIQNLKSVFNIKDFDIRTCDSNMGKLEMFEEIKSDYKDRNIVGLIDDQAHNLMSAYTVFGHNFKLFHIIRGERSGCTVACTVISCLSQVVLEDLS